MRGVAPVVQLDDRTSRYKRAAIANVAALAHLVRQQLPELGEADAMQLSGQVVLAIGATWTHARPSPSMLA